MAPAFLLPVTVVSGRAIRLAPRSSEPDRIGVADAVGVILVGVALERLRLCADFFAFESDCGRADEDPVAFVVVLVVFERLRTGADLAGFLAAVALTDLPAAADSGDVAPEVFAGGLELDGALAGAVRVGADAGVALVGVDLALVGVGEAVDGELPALFPVEAGFGAASLGALSAPACAGAETVGEVVRFGVVAMRVLAIAGVGGGTERYRC